MPSVEYAANTINFKIKKRDKIMQHKIALTAGRYLLSWFLFAIISGSAIAQERNFNSTIYGRVDSALVYQSGRGSGGPMYSLGSGLFQPSQIGFKGQEDLGGGLRAVFGTETTISVDTGSQSNPARFFDRNAFVGIASNKFGTFSAGRQVTPLAELFYATDPLRAGNGATNMNVRFGYLGGAGLPIANNFGPNASFAGNNLDRQDNTLKYTFSSNTGLVISSMYGFGEAADGLRKSNSAGFLVGYDVGPLTLRGAAMQFHDAKGVALDAFALGTAYQITNTLSAKLTWTKNKILNESLPYRDLTTKVYSAGLRWSPQPDLNLTTAFYYGSRDMIGGDKQIARKLYFVPEYKASVRTSFYALLNLERFNAAGSQLDTGTPLVLGSSGSNYLAVGISHSF